MRAKKAGLSLLLALWSDAARSRGVSVVLAGVAFVADDGAGLNVGSDVEQGLEVTRVGSFADGQVEGDDVAGGVRFCVDFLVKPPRERPSAWPSCPLLLRPPTHARARGSNRTSE